MLPYEINKNKLYQNHKRITISITLIYLLFLIVLVILPK